MTQPVDRQARETAANGLDTTLFVEAAAGTGKTTALVARILSAVASGRARLPEIVAITFTEKAAGELKVRLRERLEETLRGAQLAQALSDLERAHITTIHSFCAWILRERPVEAVVDPQFVVADDLQRQLLLEQAWEEWLETELAHNPPALRQALMRGIELDRFPELVAQLVDHRDRLDRATQLDAMPLDAANVLARVKSVAPALERCLKHFRERTDNSCVRAQTLLDTLPSLDQASTDRQIAVLRSLEITAPKAIALLDGPEAFREMKDLTKQLKALLDDFRAAADHNFLVALVNWLRGFVDHFQKVKHERAVLDFDDLLLKTRNLVRDNTEVRADLQRRFKFVVVDEFQDTDPVQTELVLLLGQGAPGKLFVVGDPKQSIYGFRRADIEMYANARRQIEKTGKTLTFQQNFRSRSTILDWVNDVFSKILVKSEDGHYQPEYIPLKPRPDLKTTEPSVTLLRPNQFLKATADELRRAEAETVARYLRRQVAAGACQWGDVALLFRAYTGVETYSEVLEEHGVPFRVIGGRGYYQRQEIQTLSSLLSCLDNPADKLNLVAVLRSPLFGWADEGVFLVAQTMKLDYLADVPPTAPEQVKSTFALLRELHESRHSFSVPGYVEHVLARARVCEAFFASEPDGAQCLANLLKALELARQLEALGLHSVRAFVRRLRETVLGGVDEEPSPATEETDNVVRILTIHKAKGLEFPVVVLADLAGRSSDSGAKLLFRADGGAELRFARMRTAGFDATDGEQEKREEAEEIRLLYVAATRAKQRLVIPWFAEKGGRIDLLARGFKPEASELVELPDLASLAPDSPEAGKPAAEAGSVSQLIDKRRQWEASRIELLARAAKPLSRVSPSKLAGETEPPDDEVIGAGREQAMEFGSVVHDALEMVDLEAKSAQQRAQIEHFIAQTGLNDEQKHRAVNLAIAAVESELMDRVRHAQQIYREVPFSHVVDDGLMEGKIDLLFCENDRWVLVDYKTDAREEAGKYARQLRAYATALQHVAGIAIAEKLLFFLASGIVRKVDG
ncbi:MAG TPA: UvrD-helicase domain-containing protein [Verrucomicrobiae bacterium]|nr:UvrD-helicase domain-containing protein [Verrucomicrobiae bacterium]